MIVGGGVTGLAAAGFLAESHDCTLLEREREIGGYCRTIEQDGFTWDCSGHFFHFREPWVAAHLGSRLDRAGEIEVRRIARVYLNGSYVDVPFQFHIHQLPLADFLRCLNDMYAARSAPAADAPSFRDMVHARYGTALAEMFLIPYNEKLHATRAENLDAGAMGRFFPHIDFGTLLKNLATRVEQPTYNTTFRYHRRGARAYVEALASWVPRGVIHTGTTCERIDLDRRVVHARGETIAYDRLIATAPLPRILEMAGIEHDPRRFSANKVLVLNLGFDKPSPRPDHWVYYPEPEWVFFRVGHYDNILGGERMSLYVEISLPAAAPVDVEACLRRVLGDLERCGVIRGHRLVSHVALVLDPAYVHVSRSSDEAAAEGIARLEARDVHPLGRYGRWTYCSIEDNIIAAQRLARSWGGARDVGPA